MPSNNPKHNKSHSDRKNFTKISLDYDRHKLEKNHNKLDGKKSRMVSDEEGDLPHKDQLDKSIQHIQNKQQKTNTQMKIEQNKQLNASLLNKLLGNEQITRSHQYSLAELKGYAALSNALVQFIPLNPLDGVDITLEKKIKIAIPMLLNTLEKSLSYLTGNPDLIKTIGTIFMYQKDFATAEKYYLRLKDSILTDGQLFHLLVTLYFEWKKYKACVSLINEGLNSHKLGCYYLMLGACYSQLQNYELALLNFNIAKKTHEPGAENQIVNLKLCQDYLAKGLLPPQIITKNSYNFWELVAKTIYQLDQKYFLNNETLKQELLFNTY